MFKVKPIFIPSISFVFPEYDFLKIANHLPACFPNSEMRSINVS